MITRSALFVVGVLFAAASPILQARAEEPTRIGDMRIETAWARSSIGATSPGAAYLTIVNEGVKADRLVAVETPVAAKAEIHETVNEGGVMKMQPASRIEIPSGGRVELKPGGLHVMMMGLREPLKRGTTLVLNLTFEKNGSGSLDVPIAGPGATRPPQ